MATRRGSLGWCQDSWRGWGGAGCSLDPLTQDCGAHLCSPASSPVKEGVLGTEARHRECRGSRAERGRGLHRLSPRAHWVFRSQVTRPPTSLQS